MLPIIVSADLHVRDGQILGRDRLPVCIEMLDGILTLAQLHNAKHIILVGDLIDKKNNPPLGVLLAVYAWLTRCRAAGVEVFWIRGNHESPSLANPEDTIMWLFSDICVTVIKPYRVKIDHKWLYMLPYYPGPDFIRYAEEFAIDARQRRAAGQQTFLFAHVGLKEGRVSASNIQLPQYVSVRHLHAEMYDLVLLGDYHAHQQLAENVFYCGAPIPHTFGDEGIAGPWLVDTDNVELEPLVLPHRPPQFCQWTIQSDHELSLPGYRPEDYNRIRAHPALLDSTRIRYPDADVRLLDSAEWAASPPEVSQSRLSVADTRSPERLIDKYLEYARVDEKERKVLREVGMGLIKQAV